MSLWVGSPTLPKKKKKERKKRQKERKSAMVVHTYNPVSRG
jgi:hypothetical protein